MGHQLLGFPPQKATVKMAKKEGERKRGAVEDDEKLPRKLLVASEVQNVFNIFENCEQRQFLEQRRFREEKSSDMRQRAHTESTSLEDGMSHMTEGTLPKKRKKTARRHRRNFLQYRGSVKFFWSRCFFLSLSFFSSLLLLLLLLVVLLEKSSTSIEKFDGPKRFHPDRKKFDLDSIRPPSSHGWIRNARGTTGGRPSPRPVCYCPIARGGAHPWTQPRTPRVVTPLTGTRKKSELLFLLLWYLHGNPVRTSGHLPSVCLGASWADFKYF